MTPCWDWSGLDNGVHAEGTLTKQTPKTLGAGSARVFQAFDSAGTADSNGEAISPANGVNGQQKGSVRPLGPRAASLHFPVFVLLCFGPVSCPLGPERGERWLKCELAAQNLCFGGGGTAVTRASFWDVRAGRAPRALRAEGPCFRFRALLLPP